MEAGRGGKGREKKDTGSPSLSQEEKGRLRGTLTRPGTRRRRICKEMKVVKRKGHANKILTREKNVERVDNTILNKRGQIQSDIREEQEGGGGPQEQNSTGRS